MSSLIVRLQTLKQQLQTERLALPPLRHVRIQWPDDEQEFSSCPAPYPPKLYLEVIKKQHRRVILGENIRVYPGWVTMHYLETRSRTPGALERAQEVARVRPLLLEAGRIVAQIPDASPATSMPAARSRWLLTLHDLLESDERFTWNLEMPFPPHDRHPVVIMNLDRARAEAVHQCEVFEDAVLASIRAIDVLLSPLATDAEPAASQNSIVLETDVVRIMFRGNSTSYPLLKGFRILALLLASPNAPCDCLRLAGRPNAEQSRGPVMDPQYVAEVKEDLARAEAAGNPEDAAILREALRKAHNIRGVAREEGGSRDKARKSVGKAIETALQRVARNDAVLYEHLRSAVRSPAGRTPCYRPADGVGRWFVSPRIICYPASSEATR